MGQTFIGFYWTLPVKWAGIFKLPTKPGQKSYDAVNEAAAASRTIYYQRELVKRYIFEQHGHNGRLDREFVYMEADPDRVSEGIREVIDIIAPLCARKDEQGKSKLLYVNFADMDEASSPNWRRHNELNHYVKSKHIEALGLSPKPIRLRDKRFDPNRDFDPIEHFKDWRRRGLVDKAERSEAIRPRLEVLLQEVPKGRGRYALLAESLNNEKVKTLTGRTWTSENVRAICKRWKLNI